MKIGVIKEGKVPVDRRVAFSPDRLAALQLQYAERISFKVAPSSIRCFSDQEYRDQGIEVDADLSDCDVLFGIKEVPVDQLIPGKTYFFFSHTIKKQAYNQTLIQAVLAKNIRLIDYEVLKNEEGERIVAFGRWAGIVGAYNGLWTYGQKSGLYDLKRAKDCFDRNELDRELGKVQLPPIKIVVTGDGRVAGGVLEVMNTVGILQVTPVDFLHKYFDEPVFTQIGAEIYNRRKTDGGFEKEEFYKHPEKYESHFLKFAEVSDMLIAAAYWDPKAPKLFSSDQLADEDFNLSVIADITCDINGSIPTTIRPSTINDPVYDIDRETKEELPAFGKQISISVMAIDNLPTELPRDASEDFGNQLSQYIIPALLEADSPMLEKATITLKGALTPNFEYLSEYAYGPSPDRTT
ncbi:NAD(P)-dependent oxidoreductase [Pararhodonellum marinum]|uniref:NAD(P)-dependent oxidoreductase n=1 Tax=Pararhodonellum marinum TaxID=2755358 RepID=UPI00188DCE6F|nr:NAD(P)-dependent oxidoreductase [Pararhodonellum marinum]